MKSRKIAKAAKYLQNPGKTAADGRDVGKSGKPMEGPSYIRRPTPLGANLDYYLYKYNLSYNNLLDLISKIRGKEDEGNSSDSTESDEGENDTGSTDKPLDEATLRRIIYGQTIKPHRRTIERIASALGVDVEDLTVGRAWERDPDNQSIMARGEVREGWSDDVGRELLKRPRKKITVLILEASSKLVAVLIGLWHFLKKAPDAFAGMATGLANSTAAVVGSIALIGTILGVLLADRACSDTPKDLGTKIKAARVDVDASAAKESIVAIGTPKQQGLGAVLPPIVSVMIVPMSFLKIMGRDEEFNRMFSFTITNPNPIDIGYSITSEIISTSNCGSAILDNSSIIKYTEPPPIVRAYSEAKPIVLLDTKGVFLPPRCAVEGKIIISFLSNGLVYNEHIQSMSFVAQRANIDSKVLDVRQEGRKYRIKIKLTNDGNESTDVKLYVYPDDTPVFCETENLSPNKCILPMPAGSELTTELVMDSDDIKTTDAFLGVLDTKWWALNVKELPQVLPEGGEIQQCGLAANILGVVECGKRIGTLPAKTALPIMSSSWWETEGTLVPSVG